MNENIEDNDWMKENPTLAALGKGNPFVVPDGYFEKGGEAIFSAIFMDGLKEKTNENSFEVPPHYFEELTARIETQVSLTQQVEAKNNFAVPEDYFDTLQSRITQKINASEPRKKAKVVSLWNKNFFKYASAACFLLVSSFGLYFYQNQETTITETRSVEMANEQMLYDIDESTIIEHIEAQHASQPATKTTSASDTEMENYILSNFSSSDLTQELNN